MKKIILLLVILNSFFIPAQVKDVSPVKPIRSYQIKIKNLNGKDFYLYNDEDNTYLRGKFEITFFASDTSKKDTLIIDNGIPRKTLQYDIEYSNYSKLNIHSLGVFNDGYKTGLWKTFYKNKLVKTENWNNGLLINEYKVYNTTGKLLYETGFGTQGSGKYKDYYYVTETLKEEGSYLNGKKEGEWCSYNESGQLMKTIFYKAGELIRE